MACWSASFAKGDSFMSNVVRLVHAIIRWGMLLAVVGGLGEATVEIFGKAAKAHKTGLISLGQLNRDLGVRSR